MEFQLLSLKRKLYNLEKSVRLGQVVDRNDMKSTTPIWLSVSGKDNSYMLAFNPCLSESTPFSFHQTGSPFISYPGSSTGCFSPLTWIALVKSDPALSHFLVSGIPTSFELETSPPCDIVFANRFARQFEEDLDYEQKSRKLFKVSFDSRKMANFQALPVGLTVYEGDLNAEKDIAKRARLLLPPRRALWMLVDVFFAKIYPQFPFLDQFDFESSITEFIGPKDTMDFPVESLVVKTKSQIAHIGILLLVLRLAYLTLLTTDFETNHTRCYSSDDSPKAVVMRYLLQHPIHIDVFDVAMLCLHEFGYLRLCNIPIFQLSLYIHIYKTFGPESGEGTEISNADGSFAQLIELGKSLGLHREPNNFSTEIRDRKTNHLCRKMWSFLVTSDINYALNNGSKPLLSREIFDTKPPFYLPGCENTRDSDLERHILNSMAQFDLSYDLFSDIFNMVSGISKNVDVKEFCSRISSIETRYLDRLQTTEPMAVIPGDSNHLADFQRSHNTGAFFQSQIFLVGICYHFFIHYERDGEYDMAYFYLKKLFVVCITHKIPFFDSFVKQKFFKDTSDVCSVHYFVNLVQKCLIVLEGQMSRMRLSIVKHEMLPTHSRDLATKAGYKERFLLLQEVHRLCEECSDVFFGFLKYLQDRYYYAWCGVKLQALLKKTRMDTELLLKELNGTKAYMKLPNSMLADFVDLLRDSLEIPKTSSMDKGLTTELGEMSGEEVGKYDTVDNGRETSSRHKSDGPRWQQLLHMNAPMKKTWKGDLALLAVQDDDIFVYDMAAHVQVQVHPNELSQLPDSHAPRSHYTPQPSTRNELPIGSLELQESFFWGI